MSYQPPFHKELFHSTRRLIAKKWLSHQKALQIAVTGSQGKTITSQTIAKVLEKIGSTVVTDPNLDTIYNVPLTALRVLPWTKFVVFELGVDHPNEMDFHLSIVKPKIAVMTGISPVHTDIEHLGSLENLINEKRKLIETLPSDGYAILNYDDKHVRKMAKYTKAKILWYGRDKKNCDVWSDNIKISLDGTKFNLRSSLSDTESVDEAKTYLIGKHNVYTIMATYLVLKAVYEVLKKPFSTAELLATLKDIEPLPGRMNVEHGPMKTVLLNDSLRANPASTAAGLETLADIKYEKGRKIAILAEMGELAEPEEEHRKIGKLFGKLKIDYLIAIGPLQHFTAEEAKNSGMKKENIFWVNDVFAAAEILRHLLKSGDLIYLKGSLLRHVERVILLLQGVKVDCTVISCPFYWHCLKCPYLESGYQNVPKRA